MFLRIVTFLCVGILGQLNQTISQCSPSCSGNNTSLGIDAGDPSASGTFNNSYYGHEAGMSNTVANNNSFFGRAAGSNTVGSEVTGQENLGTHNSFFGSTCGFANTTGYDNAFFGSYAGRHNTYGSRNSFFGREAGYSNTGGLFNSFFGRGAGYANTTGGNNSFYGSGTGDMNNEGSANSFFGSGTGNSNTTGDGNCFFGVESGLNNSSGNRNSFFGVSSGANIQGDSNIAIGCSAGPTFNQEDISHRLYIDNHRTNDPLIYGELDNHFVRINGSFEVTAGLSNPSSRNQKTDFQSVDKQKILDKLQDLNIQQWVYKERPDELHIGPVAEEFYAAFGLGADDKRISTIDSDGVMMLAIQALLEENNQLKLEKDKIELRIYHLEKLVSKLISQDK